MPKYIPNCPNCGSTNVKAINHYMQGLKVGLLLPFSINKLFDNVGKSWYCNSCKAEF